MREFASPGVDYTFPARDTGRYRLICMLRYGSKWENGILAYYVSHVGLRRLCREYVHHMKYLWVKAEALFEGRWTKLSMCGEIHRLFEGYLSSVENMSGNMDAMWGSSEDT